MRAMQGLRLLWGEIEPRKRLTIEGIVLAWLNVAIITGLSTWARIAQTHTAEVVFAVGAMVDVVGIYAWFVCRLQPAIRREIAESLQERREIRETRASAKEIPRG